MKHLAGGVIVIALLALATGAAQQKEFPTLQGRFLGQPPPETTPETFAPGVISTGAVEACLCFSHDDRFLVFRRGFREDTEIYLSENIDGRWTEPERAPFFIKDFRFGDFTCSPYEPVLYFTSDRPAAPGQPRAESANLWRVEYRNGQWLDPSPVAGAINSTRHESYPSVSNDATLYFFRRYDAENGGSEIMYSKPVNGIYAEPERMGAEINTEWDEWDPAISPDGSMLVFCSTKPSGLGRDDLYVSFRTVDDSWTDAVNLGDEINSGESENRPFITADGKYLFYNSSVHGTRDVYWVDLSVVEELRPTTR